MFNSVVSLHLAKVTMKTETRNDVTTAVAGVSLVLEPLTRALARELSPEIADHCFTKDGGIRPEIANFNVRLRELQQFVTARMAEDAGVHATLRYVRCVGLSVSKRGEVPGEEVEKKSKKVGPTSEILRATLQLLIDPDSADVREFLMRRFGNTFFFQFEDEAKQLDFESHADDDDDDDEEEPANRQPKLRAAPEPDPAAGDVLEEQLILRTLAEFKIEVTPAKFRVYLSDQQAQLLEWARAVDNANAEPGASFDSLPKPPAFLFDRKATKKTVAAIAPTAAETERKARAPRRSSTEFKNTPRVAGKVHKITDGKRGKAKG